MHRTEVGQLTVVDIVSDDPRDWQYVRFLDPGELHMVPDESGAGTKGLCRMVVKVRLGSLCRNATTDHAAAGEVP